MARGPKLITKLGINDREFTRKLDKAGQSAIAWSKKVASGAVSGALGLGAGGLLGGRNTFFTTDVGQSIKAAKILEPQTADAAAMLRHGDEALSLVGADGDGQFREWATSLRDAAKRAMTGDQGANVAFRRLGIAGGRADIESIANAPISALAQISQRDKIGEGIWRHQDFETLGLGELRDAMQLDRFTQHMRRRQDPSQHAASFFPEAEQRYWSIMRALRGAGLVVGRSGEAMMGGPLGAPEHMQNLGGVLSADPNISNRMDYLRLLYGKQDPEKRNLRPNGG